MSARSRASRRSDAPKRKRGQLAADPSCDTFLSGDASEHGKAYTVIHGERARPLSAEQTAKLVAGVWTILTCRCGKVAGISERELVYTYGENRGDLRPPCDICFTRPYRPIEVEMTEGSKLLTVLSRGVEPAVLFTSEGPLPTGEDHVPEPPAPASAESL